MRVERKKKKLTNSGHHSHSVFTRARAGISYAKLIDLYPVLTRSH